MPYVVIEDIMFKREVIMALQKADSNQKRRIIQTVERYAWLVHGEGIRIMPRDQGDLARHHHVRMSPTFTTTVAEVYNNARHAAAVEKGSVPHWPPPGALAQWASKHGITEAAARYSVAVNGTPAQPFMRPAFDRHKNAFRNAIRNAVP